MRSSSRLVRLHCRESASSEPPRRHGGRHLGFEGSVADEWLRGKQTIFHNIYYATYVRKRHIEMTPLCAIEVTLPRVPGSRGLRRGGVWISTFNAGGDCSMRLKIGARMVAHSFCPVFGEAP